MRARAFMATIGRLQYGHRQEQNHTENATQEQRFECTSLPGRQVYLKEFREEGGQRELRIDLLDEEGIGSLLRSCLLLPEGRRVHAHMIDVGLEQHTLLANLLVRMYGKCGDINSAESLFNKLHQRDLVSWNTLMGAYAKEDKGCETLQLLGQMKSDCLEPDRVTYLTTLKACASMASLIEGEKIHALVLDSGYESNLMTATALVDMYGKCGALEQARIAFDKILELDVAAWNSMIGAYTQKGLVQDALRLFGQMREEGTKPNRITFINTLGACISLENLIDGKAIHACIVDELLESDVVVANALVTMYGKCGDLENARIMFDKIEERTVVSWTAMITECSRQGCNREALELFYQMQEEGMKPDKVTFISVLSACASLEALAEGKEIHALVTYKGFESDVLIGTALVNMYGKCSLLKDAHALFNNISQHNVVSWNAIIAAYAQQGLGNEALEVFRQMQREGVKPDNVTFISALSACACVGALDEGKVIHNSTIDFGLELDVVVGNAIVNMYGKCAALHLAQSTFDSMHERNVITWTALITAYAQQGHGITVLNLYKKMQQEGVKPNKTTFLSLLSACGHAGLIDEGCSYFISMSNKHGIEPGFEHYGSMIDLFGRAGLLIEAEELISKMPFEADACIWTALLGACRMHGDIERAKQAAENVIRLEGHNAGASLLGG